MCSNSNVAIYRKSQQCEQSLKTKQMFTRTFTLLIVFLVASGWAQVTDGVIQDFGANLRGTVFEFDCEHIYFVFYKEGKGLFVHKASTKDTSRHMQLLGEMKPMQEVFPDIYSMIVKHIPTDSFSKIEYISSATYYQLRMTVITNSSSELLITQYEDKHDTGDFNEARNDQVVKSISACKRSLPQSNFYFQSDYEIKRQDYSKKEHYEQLFKVWVADKSDDIYMTTNEMDEQKAKSLSYRLFNFKYYKRGFWHEEYIILFQSNQGSNPNVLVFRTHSNGSMTSTMLRSSCKAYFDSGLTNIETNSKATPGKSQTSSKAIPIKTETNSKATLGKSETSSEATPRKTETSSKATPGKSKKNLKTIPDKPKKSSKTIPDKFKTSPGKLKNLIFIIIILVVLAVVCLIFLGFLSCLRSGKRKVPAKVKKSKKDWNEKPSMKVSHKIIPKTKKDRMKVTGEPSEFSPTQRSSGYTIRSTFSPSSMSPDHFRGSPRKSPRHARSAPPKLK